MEKGRTMRVWQKQINYLLLFSLSIFFMMPTTIFANEDSSGKGKMQIKIDRILQDDQEQQAEITELDKVFPELFSIEIKEKLDEQQQISQQETTALKESLFTEEFQQPSIYDMKSDLFAEPSDLTHEVSLEDLDEEEAGASSSVSTIIFYTTVVMVVTIGIGIVMLIVRKLNF